MVSEVMSGAESDFESEIKSSYPSRTSEKSELEMVGLCPRMFCDPRVVAARDARLASGALAEESQLVTYSVRELRGCPVGYVRHVDKGTKN
jgi:hypothetical protein